MPTKLVVTAEAAMKKKYGGAGWANVRKAITRLAAADAPRGVTTTLVALDDASLGPARATPGDRASYKGAIDQAWRANQQPDYVLILGGPDVVPHQSLRNPVPDDDDADVPSDLPYACSAPPGDLIEGFVAPTRVVGRLPDLPGDGAPARLIGFLDQAARWKPKTKADYKTFFGLSAHKWRRSTTLSLKAMFGAAAATRTSPAEGPGWQKADLVPLVHFINCHGGTLDPQFYGQRGDEYPVAHRAVLLPGKVARGTVVAAECCYGAEVYEPDAATPPGICIQYLENGAVGFLGSTNTAYGPSTTNAEADLICRFFVESVLKGATLGRALLEARLRFVKEAKTLSPTELKTLGQFLLLGDPSLRPVAAGPGKGKGKAAAGATSLARAASAHATVRGQLVSEAMLVAKGIDSADSTPDGVAPDAIRARLERDAREEGCRPLGPARSFHVQKGPDPASRAALGAKAVPKSAPTRFHVLMATPVAPPAAAHPPEAPRPQGISDKMVLVGREVGGKLVEVERLFAHGRLGPR